MLSKEAKELLSKNAELCEEILFEFKNSLGTSDVKGSDIHYFLNDSENLPNTCPHCGISTDGSSNEQCYKAPQRDWEVLSFSVDDRIVVPPTTGLVDLFTEQGCKIHSVHRLSDGEVFTVGDSHEYPTGLVETIKGFDISDNVVGLCFTTDKVIWSRYNLLKKSKQPLFVTEDGVEVFVGGANVFYVNSDFVLAGERTVEESVDIFKSCIEGGGKYFSTREKAEEYVLWNKPCLSVNDIKSFSTATVYEIVANNMKQVVKQKASAK